MGTIHKFNCQYILFCEDLILIKIALNFFLVSLTDSKTLTRWGRVTHICVWKPTIIGSDDGLSPDLRQPIIWNNVGILLIKPLGLYFSEILIKTDI